MTEIPEPFASCLMGLRVLVVEDEILLAMELVDELEELGAIPVGPIQNLEAAMAAVHEHHFDAAMLDVDLNGSLSLPIANALQERGTPFLFVTGNDAFVRAHFPAIPVHPKPCDMALIVDALELLVRQRSPAAPKHEG